MPNMYIEMTCSCTSSFSLDTEEEYVEHIWHLAWRFANAHVRCGYVTPTVNVDEEIDAELEKKKAKVTSVHEEEEEDE